MDKLEMSRDEQMGGGGEQTDCAGGGGGRAEEEARAGDRRASRSMPLAHTAHLGASALSGPKDPRGARAGTGLWGPPLLFHRGTGHPQGPRQNASVQEPECQAGLPGMSCAKTGSRRPHRTPKTGW